MPIYYSSGSTSTINNILSGSGRPTTTPSGIGQLYLDTTNGTIYVSNGTSSAANWIPQTFGYENYKFSGLFDDFYNYTSGQFWTTGGGTGSVSTIAGTINGKIAITTGAVATNTEYVNDTAGNIAQSNTAKKRVSFRVNLPSTGTGKFFIGETDTVATPDGVAANTIAFSQNSGNTAPTHWYIFTNVAGTITNTDTGIVVTTGSYTYLDLIWDNTGANVSFYVNDVLAGTLATMPAIAMNVIMFADATGAAAATLNVDFAMAIVPRL